MMTIQKIFQRLEVLFDDWFGPVCPRWDKGYKCKKNSPGGCPDCGRGK